MRIQKIKELANILSESNLEEITRAKVDSSIENISLKLESLEQETPFNYVESDYY